MILSTDFNEIKPKLSLKTLHCSNCDKNFKERTGLWRHKQKCINKDDIIVEGINIKDKDALVLHLLKQNVELQNKLIDFSMDKYKTNKKLA